MDKLLERVKLETENISEEVISLRRFFHQHPELGFEEYITSEKISTFLEQENISYQKVAKTGIVASIGKGDLTIGLRADMDALPVEEKTGLPFSSVHKGLMHACGHDGHMAVVLGVAKVLKRLEEHLNFTIKFIFQPSEERSPSGANVMVKEGVLDTIDYLLGFHFFPILPIFGIWIGEGPVMANADFFSINISGLGGHGASPHLAIDPIICTASLISNLQTIVSRNISPLKPAVLSICSVSGGTTYNVIPQKVEIKGTVRTLDTSVQNKIRNLIETKSRDICSSFGCKAEFKYDTHTPLCVNEPTFAQQIKNISKTILKPENLLEFHPIMGGEDFAYFSKVVPSCYLFVGIGDKFGDNHNNNFSIDESVLPYTVNFFSNLLIQLGANKKTNG